MRQTCTSDCRCNVQFTCGCCNIYFSCMCLMHMHFVKDKHALKYLINNETCTAEIFAQTNGNVETNVGNVDGLFVNVISEKEIHADDINDTLGSINNHVADLVYHQSIPETSAEAELVANSTVHEQNTDMIVDTYTYDEEQWIGHANATEYEVAEENLHVPDYHDDQQFGEVSKHVQCKVTAENSLPDCQDDQQISQFGEVSRHVQCEVTAENSLPDCQDDQQISQFGEVSRHVQCEVTAENSLPDCPDGQQMGQFCEVSVYVYEETPGSEQESPDENLLTTETDEPDVKDTVELLPLLQDPFPPSSRPNNQVPCDICGRLFKRRNIKRHKESHGDSKEHTCDICSKNFKTKSQLYCHKLHHKTEKDLVCHLCGKSFNNGPNLRQHLKSHTRKRTLQCPICPKTFRSNYVLKDHMQRHSDDKPYACSVCNRAFRKVQEVKRHMIMHSETRDHPCSLCNKMFKSKSNRIKHEKSHIKDH